MVLISRGAAGAFAGGAGVATMAYVIDVSEPSKRAANLAVYTAMQSVSLAAGYLLSLIHILQRRKLELCGLADLFEVIVISGEFKAHKPDVEIFLEGARQLELPPEEIAFVGDTFFTDIIGAYRAGMQPIWIFANPGQQCQADLPRIYRIEELLDLL